MSSGYYTIARGGALTRNAGGDDDDVGAAQGVLEAVLLRQVALDDLSAISFCYL